MSNNRIRITKPLSGPERELKGQGTNKPLNEWLRLSIEDLEHRLRYSKEETQALQGALRVLDDIQGILER